MSDFVEFMRSPNGRSLLSGIANIGLALKSLTTPVYSRGILAWTAQVLAELQGINKALTSIATDLHEEMAEDTPALSTLNLPNSGHNHAYGETCWSDCPGYSGPRKASDPGSSLNTEATADHAMLQWRFHLTDDFAIYVYYSKAEGLTARVWHADEPDPAHNFNQTVLTNEELLGEWFDSVKYPELDTAHRDKDPDAQ